MALLDWIVWTSPDLKQGLALKQVRDGEFWSRGYRGGDARFSGALMIEAGAQLACFLFNSRSEDRPNAAFLRLEDTSVWHEPRPGEDLYLLCSEIKYSRRRFVSEIQGVVAGSVAFAGRISGMAI
jgi:3-hydroxyacyl-[acyl-carrier-protein] dehydratase